MLLEKSDEPQHLTVNSGGVQHNRNMREGTINCGNQEQLVTVFVKPSLIPRMLSNKKQKYLTRLSCHCNTACK